MNAAISISDIIIVCKVLIGLKTRSSGAGEGGEKNSYLSSKPPYTFREACRHPWPPQCSSPGWSEPILLLSSTYLSQYVDSPCGRAFAHLVSEALHVAAGAHKLYTHTHTHTDVQLHLYMLCSLPPFSSSITYYYYYI